MEHTTIDNDQGQVKSKIPTFLKVICILTFIGAGLGILGGIASLTFVTPEIMYKTVLKNASNLGGVPPPFEEYKEWITYQNIVNLIMALMSLAGGILMWRLNKMGFYIYVVSWIGYVAMSAAAFEHISDSESVKFMALGISLNVIFMLTFVIMYAVNLKHMK